MMIYLVSQTQVDGYDTYDSVVVIAACEYDARRMNPGGWGDCWCRSPDDVNVELLGFAAPGSKPGIVLASFNAG